MDTAEALAKFAADLHDATLTFKPKSPIQSVSTPASANAASIAASASAAADYRLDLTLQQLLAIGAEFAPDDIIGLRKRARYGDARWLWSLYDEMMRLGPASQVLKAREAIKGTQTVWKATPEEADEDENSTDPEDKAARLIRDVTEEAWAKWLPDLKTQLSTKFFYGIAACQVMWKPKAIENKWARVTDIRPIPARRFRLDPQTLRFMFLSNPFSWEGPYVDDLQKTGKLIFVEVGGDSEPLDQRGLLFQCLIPWAFEQFAVRWRGKKLQNFGMPPVMVTYQKGDPQNKATADMLADLLAGGTRASIPEGMKAELLAAAQGGGRGSDPYENAVEWCERQYDKTILGHSQVSGVQVGAGSRTSSNDAIGLFKDVTNSRAKELDVDLEQQCFGPYVVREFGQEWADNHTPTVVSSVIERDNAVELAGVLAQLGQAGLGSVIAAEDAVERCTLKIAEDGEMTMAGNIKGEEPAAPPVEALSQPGVAQAASGAAAAAAPAKIGAKPAPQLPPAVGAEKPAQGVKVEAKADAPKAAHGPATAKEKGKETAAPKKKGQFAAMGDVQAPARYVLRRRKGRKAIQEFYTRRQRFAAAAVVGLRPHVTITSFGHEHGVPDDGSLAIDVRSMSAAHPYDFSRTGKDPEVRDALEAHPLTGPIYGGVKTRVIKAVKAADVTGDNVNVSVGCEHGKHRSVYVAERLAEDLLRDGHDVTVEHRDANDVEKSGEVGIGDPDNVVAFPADKAGPGRLLTEQELRDRAAGQFYSEGQLRDDHGRWTVGENASTPDEHAKAVEHHERRYRDAVLADKTHVAYANRLAGEVHTMALDNPGNASISEWARSASRGANRATESAYPTGPTGDVNDSRVASMWHRAEGGEQFYSEAQQRDPNGRWTAGNSEIGRHAENANSIDSHAIASAYHHDAATTLLRKEPGGAADVRRGPSPAWEKAAMAHAKAGAFHGRASRGDHGASDQARDASKEAHAAAAKAMKQPRFADLPTGVRTTVLSAEDGEEFAGARVPVRTRAAAQAHAKLHAAMRARLQKQYAAALDEAKKALAEGGAR